MQPFPKRQRLYALIERDFPQSFDSQEAYYDGTPDSEMVEDGKELEEEGPEFDQDSLFQERRARLDFKLKSTFEAIFEKYGRDFDGIGDEIDMATGEIVVNNGHLLRMQDEMDAGESLSSREQSEVTDELNEGAIVNLDDYDDEDDEEGADDGEEVAYDDDDDDDDDDEEEEEEEDEDDEIEITSENDVVEDDLILRGFARAKRMLQASPELGTLRKPPLRREHLDVSMAASRVQPAALLTPSQILAQFGPDVGPQILDIVSQKQMRDVRQIEPAWRFPDIPVSRPVKPPIIKIAPFLPDIERSPSPEARVSVWASSAGGHGGPRRRLPNFTADEDEVLSKAVAIGLRKGLRMREVCEGLEAKYPTRTWYQWRDRFKRIFTSLPRNYGHEDSDLTSEPSAFANHNVNQPQHENRLLQRTEASDASRPIRNRKPAQTDSKIISWQEAINVLDPDEHAEILEDARRMKASKKPAHHSEHSQRTHSSVDLPHLGWENEWSDQNVLPRMQGRKEDTAPQLETIEATPELDEALIPGARCGHFDCKSSRTKFKLQPRKDEDISEMNLHLFRDHHTTPFPCCEENCPRTGIKGYFMQVDLVNHVRRKHTGIGALKRLRGRVASELLDRNILRSLPRESPEGGPPNKPSTRQREPDFMSPSKAHWPQMSSSSGGFPSNSDPDRTLTPTAATQTGPSSFTPMTSISSMIVHHSSSTNVPTRDMSNSSERGTQEKEGSVEIIGSEYYLSKKQQPYGIHQTQHSQRISSLEHIVPRPNDGFGSLPTATTSSGLPLRLSASMELQSIPTSTPQQVSGYRKTGSDMGNKALVGCSTPLPRQNLRETPYEIPNSSSVGLTPLAKPLHTTSGQGPVQISDANVPDRSYEFSEDESPFRYVSKASVLKPSSYQAPKPAVLSPQKPQPTAGSTTVSAAKGATSQNIVTPRVVQPPRTVAKTTQSALKPTVNPKSMVSSSLRTAPVQTPANPKRKSDLRKLLKSGDVDELSLCDDDLILISSRPKANPKLDPKVRIKRENTSSPRVTPAVTAKKRKLSMCQGSDEVDELGLEKDVPRSAVPQLEIKAEEEGPVLASIPASKAPVTKRTRPSFILKAGVVQFTATHDQSTSTPLLDLTPSRKNLDLEIRDSAEILSPTTPHHTRKGDVAMSSSPLDELLTPVGKKGWDGDLLKQGKAVITVRTPGGTMRRCGENRFRCGRSFCFRCSSMAGTHKTLT